MLLRKILSYLHLLTNFRRTRKVSLPNCIGAEENLGRILHGGSKKKYIKRLFDPETGNVKPSQFMDSRNPTELSVNRVSTLNVIQAHEFGIKHVEKINKNNNQQIQVYRGYAKLIAQIAYDEECKIIKDDLNGTNPYHANIIYPREQGSKFEDMEIAIVLAEKSELVRFEQEVT